MDTKKNVYSLLSTNFLKRSHIDRLIDVLYYFILQWRICLPMQEMQVQSLGQKGPLSSNNYPLQYACL